MLMIITPTYTSRFERNFAEKAAVVIVGFGCPFGIWGPSMLCVRFQLMIAAKDICGTYIEIRLVDLKKSARGTGSRQGKSDNVGVNLLRRHRNFENV
jgi:hypothetical protein